MRGVKAPEYVDTLNKTLDGYAKASAPLAEVIRQAHEIAALRSILNNVAQSRNHEFS